MLVVLKEMVQLPANAYQNILETLMLNVDLNVLCTLTVPRTKHARGINVLTLALEPVESMLNAMLGITFQCAPV